MSKAAGVDASKKRLTKKALRAAGVHTDDNIAELQRAWRAAVGTELTSPSQVLELVDPRTHCWSAEGGG